VLVKPGFTFRRYKVTQESKKGKVACEAKLVSGEGNTSEAKRIPSEAKLASEEKAVSEATIPPTLKTTSEDVNSKMVTPNMVWNIKDVDEFVVPCSSSADEPQLLTIGSFDVDLTKIVYIDELKTSV
jgi:hypothetical protein